MVIDCGEPFVKATYTLEGDGPLVLECYEIITTVQEAIRVAHMPNVKAVAENLAGGVSIVTQQLVSYA